MELLNNLSCQLLVAGYWLVENEHFRYFIYFWIDKVFFYINLIIND